MGWRCRPSGLYLVVGGDFTAVKFRPPPRSLLSVLRPVKRNFATADRRSCRSAIRTRCCATDGIATRSSRQPQWRLFPSAASASGGPGDLPWQASRETSERGFFAKRKNSLLVCSGGAHGCRLRRLRRGAQLRARGRKASLKRGARNVMNSSHRERRKAPCPAKIRWLPEAMPGAARSSIGVAPVLLECRFPEVASDSRLLPSIWVDSIGAPRTRFKVLQERLEET